MKNIYSKPTFSKALNIIKVRNKIRVGIKALKFSNANMSQMPNILLNQTMSSETLIKYKYTIVSPLKFTC